MKVYIVRHGEIDLNKTKTVSGRKFDVPLNEKGRQQAKDLAKDILEPKEEYNIKHIFCSSMVRGRETASYVEEVLGIKAIADKRLEEQDFGIFDGHCWDEEEYQRVRHSPFEKIEDGESILDVVHRAYSFLDEMLAMPLEGNVLLVCHNTVGRLLSTYFASYTMDAYKKIFWNNCELHCFEVSKR